LPSIDFTIVKVVLNTLSCWLCNKRFPEYWGGSWTPLAVVLGFTVLELSSGDLWGRSQLAESWQISQIVWKFSLVSCQLRSRRRKRRRSSPSQDTLARVFDRFLPTYRLLEKSLYLRAVLSHTRSTCKCRAIKERTT